MVQLAELLDVFAVANDQIARRLRVAPVRRLGRRVEHDLQLRVRNRTVGVQPADRPLAEHRLADRHRQLGGRVETDHFHRVTP